MLKTYSVITGTGCHIPEKKVKNDDFLGHQFFDEHGIQLTESNETIISKFEQITEIRERRYVTDNQVASDIAYLAANNALVSSGTDKESLDYIIVAHNFGDVRSGSRTCDFMPSLAARVKNKLGIKNPSTIAYDLPFGCPGWVGGLIQADYYLKSGDAKRVLVIGTDTLSRVTDPHDRDCMIFSDGAGATLLQAVVSDEPVGILSHSSRSDTIEHAFLLQMGTSNKPEARVGELFLKMKGRKIYEYAINTVPKVVKDSLDKAGLALKDIGKILIHQANAKMDHAIVQRLFRLYNQNQESKEILPMIIEKLGNSSVATIPTLLDLLFRGSIDNHKVYAGNHLVFASVGAGMNVNSLIYKLPSK